MNSERKQKKMNEHLVFDHNAQDWEIRPAQIGGRLFNAAASRTDVWTNDDYREFAASYLIVGCDLPEHKKENLMIPSLINDKLIIGIERNAFAKVENLLHSNNYEDVVSLPIPNMTIKRVEIANGIKYIGDNAFGLCAQLRTAKLPQTLKRIGEGTFAECDNLIDIDLGNSLEVIGPKAFLGCYSMQTISLPKTLKYIERYAFACCSGLSRISFPRSLIEIGAHAFEGAHNLKTVVLNEGLVKLESGAFENCSSLQSVLLPRTLEDIGDNVISENQAVTFYVYPGSYGLVWAREHGYHVKSAEI